jgi:hypothetical protein
MGAWRWHGDGAVWRSIGIPLISLALLRGKCLDERRRIEARSDRSGGGGFEGLSVEMRRCWPDRLVARSAARRVDPLTRLPGCADRCCPVAASDMRLALLASLLIACVSVAAWGASGSWEISARYLAVGLPLLAAPMGRPRTPWGTRKAFP